MGFLSTIGGLIGGAIGGPIGSAIGGGLGGLGDSALGASSAKKSASTQANAATAAANAQLAMYGQTRSDQMPWLAQGGGAVNQLGYLMGINPYMPQTSPKFAMPAATKKTPYAPYNTMPKYSSGGLNSLGGYIPTSGGTNVYGGQNAGGQMVTTMGGSSGGTSTPYSTYAIGSPESNQLYGLNLMAGLAPSGGTTTGIPQGESPSGLTQIGGSSTAPSGGTQWQPNTAMGGFGSLAKPFSMADYQADPGYAFRLAEGNKALERSAAARGGLLSGAALKSTARYSQGMASQEYGNAYDRYNTNQTNLYNRLAGLSGTGQTSAGQLGQAGGNAADLYGQGLTAAAYQKATGQTAANQAWQTGLNNIGNSIGNIFGGGDSTTSGGLYGGGSGNYGNLGTINWYA
jgi:hypothetical protein